MKAIRRCKTMRVRRSERHQEDAGKSFLGLLHPPLRTRYLPVPLLSSRRAGMHECRERKSGQSKKRGFYFASSAP